MIRVMVMVMFTMMITVMVMVMMCSHLASRSDVLQQNGLPQQEHY